MDPIELGRKYDRIAAWWQHRHSNSGYGVVPLGKALGFVQGPGKALDVGCGPGGRMIHGIEAQGFTVVGLDVSREMIRLAREAHPDHRFLQKDVCTWETGEKFDLIIAWDSIFHLPLSQQVPVLKKLCSVLLPGGVLMYSFGDAIGDHVDVWQDDEFYYSSIGINGNLSLLISCGLTIRHLDLDQFPQNHVYVIACKPE